MSSIFHKAQHFAQDPLLRFSVYTELGLTKHLSDKQFLEKKYQLTFHRPINWEHPQTFNEKLQWLKLYDRKPVYTTMADKYAVKQYVASIIGEKYIIPTYGVWDSYDDIDIAELPDQFVLKCTHDSGSAVICQDKKLFNDKEARKKITRSLKRNYYWTQREWPYKNIPPRIIAEKYISDDGDGDIKDYKFFCFNGQPEFMFVASDRQNKNEETKFDFFDMNFHHLPVINGHPNSTAEIRQPESFEEMKELSKILSGNIPQVRIDFYDIHGTVYFGEITFYHFGGFVPFEPEEWDYKFGEYIHLPDNASSANVRSQ